MYDDTDPHAGAMLELAVEVQFLLSHLQRLPETRIPRYFGDHAIQRSTQDGSPQPPTHDLGYFLGRIGAVTKAYQNGEPVEKIDPPGPKPQQNGPAMPDPGAKLTDYAFLVWARDFLAAITHPASVQTIKVTRAFREHRAAQVGPLYSKNIGVRNDVSAGLPLDETSFRYGRRLASLVERYRFYTAVLIVFSIWAAVMVFSGHVLIKENEKLQHRYHLLDNRMAADRGEDGGRTRADVDGSGADRAPSTQNQSALKDPNAEGCLLPRRRSLCQQQTDLDHDKKDWEALAARWRLALSPITLTLFRAPQRFGVLFDMPNPEIPKQPSLVTNRYMMDQYIDGLLGSILPVCYACLGALASLFRQLTIKVDNETLGPSDYGGMSSSLILGVLTGSVIGIFGDLWHTDHSTALPVSTTALSLLAGFASNRVFAALDAAAERVFGRSEITPSARSASKTPL